VIIASLLDGFFSPIPALTMRHLIVGISGATGVIYGIRLLEFLQQNKDIFTHLVLSKPAERTIVEETSLSVAEVKALAGEVHPIHDIGASISSGSFRTLGMIILPCSIRTASAIASGVTDNLMTRAADVVLKERRRLVLGVRETPLHLGHLRSLTALAEMGAIVAPPVPAFYSLPQTLEDIISHTIGRILDLFDIQNDLVRRWGRTS
jgi:4-hydroxy-3-polyprenylbenzoate decarboxylase